uniref:PHD-type domain-containing protein n=1 Tax=Leersia perrieri TaxID=77586 RepID=A0A0D9WPQ3_9ORYZ
MLADASFLATALATISSPNILKQTQLNEPPSVKADSASSIVSPPSVGSTDIKVEKGVNCPNCTHNGGTMIYSFITGIFHPLADFPTSPVNAAIIGQANKSAKHTATMSSTNTEGSSSDAGTPQSQPGASFIQQQPIFPNHNAIAELVQQVLHQPVNNPNWTPPSVEYMHGQLDCQVCKVSIIDTQSVIVCDACEGGIHLKCLHHDGNNVLLKAEWYCPTCVARSKGKSLPPKYGRVIRTVDASKVNFTSGVTSQGVSPTIKDNSQELAEDETLFNMNDFFMGYAEDVAASYIIGCSDVCWVGYPLKVAANKTYYSSCNVDDISYNLEDHILIASKDKEVAPFKLQSLWEEHDSRSMMASVSPYLFASDIPESIRKPCTAEENEVFASYGLRTVPVSMICGPCEVLHVDKFQEVSKRSQVVSSKPHPIFLCRLGEEATMRLVI